MAANSPSYHIPSHNKYSTRLQRDQPALHDLSNTRDRTGHIIKKMIEAYERSMK